MTDPFGTLVKRAKGALRSIETAADTLREILNTKEYKPYYIEFDNDTQTIILTDRVHLSCDSDRFDLSIKNARGEITLLVFGDNEDENL